MLIQCGCVLQLSASEPIELSRIYPTPPSVENIEGDKFDDLKMISDADSRVSGFLCANVNHTYQWCLLVVFTDSILTGFGRRSWPCPS